MRVRWVFLALATLAQAAASMLRLGIPALMPLIRAEFGLDRTQVGLISSVLNGGAATAGIPAGHVVDRVGERLVMGYGAIAAGVVIFGMLGAGSFPLLLVVALLTGFLSSVSVPAGGLLVARWFGRHERGLAMGIRQTGVPLGGAIAAITLPLLALATNWRVALALAGLVAIGFGIAILALYREPTAERPGGAGAPRVRLADLLGHGYMRALALYSCVFGGAQWCLLSYLTLYLTETLGTSVPTAGALLATAQLSGAGARVIWGIVSDRVFHGQRTPALLLIGLIAIAASVAMALTSEQTPLWLVGGIVATLGFTLQGWNGLPHVLAPELAGAQVAGVAVGAINSAGFLGVIVFSPIFGLLVDTTGSYRVAWLSMILLLLTGLAALPTVRRAELAAAVPPRPRGA